MVRKSDPIHPGEILFEDFLEPLGISQNKLALAISVEPRRISEIVNGNRAITPDTALRLGRHLKTGPRFWLNLQQEYDLRIVERKLGKDLKRILEVEAAVK